MPYELSLLLLALAVSLDGFGVGVTYGLRRIRIPWSSILIIACCSGLILLLSTKLGAWVAAYLSPVWAKGMGAVILILIGCWAVFQVLRQRGDQGDTADNTDCRQSLSRQVEGSASLPDIPHTVVQIEFKRLGLVIQILKRPQLADLDGSGTITSVEALWLGTALSLDAFGAGIGAGFVGFSPVWTALVVAISSGAFMLAGIRIGFKYADQSLMRKLTFLPGCLLIVMGLLKLM
jgi:putative Mn2+ efflux pump MntP